MGSSAKKKNDKKKDFKKPKLKVGKARPKPTNFTDTSFRSKAIVLSQQSISTSAPTPSAKFSHHLSLLSSRSSTQRRDSLAYLTTAISCRPVTTSLPQPASMLLLKLCPLILDESNGVRAQLLRLLRTLPIQDIGAHVGQILLYTRAGLTHLAADIRSSATDILIWTTETCPNELVSCAGGWIKTLRCLLTVLHWHAPVPANGANGRAPSNAWTTMPTPTLGMANAEGKIPVKTLIALTAFLQAGLRPAEEVEELPSKWTFPLKHVESHMIPKRSNAFTHLNLFGAPRDEEGDMYVEREERRRIFHRRFYVSVQRNLETAKKEGGEAGRAAAGLGKALTEGMEGFEPQE